MVVCLALAAATVLLTDVPELRTAAPPGTWPPSLISRALMLPIPLTGMSDLRWYALPTALAALLAGAFAVGIRTPRGSSLAHATSRLSALSEHWFELLVLTVLAAAGVSATVNDTWEVSTGWMFHFLVGGVWAAVLGGLLDLKSAGRILLGGSIVAVGASILSIWHRQVMGIRFFELPIGPVTVTAALGAAWTAVALARLAASSCSPGERRRPWLGDMIWTGVVGGMSLLLLVVAGRRGAWIGLFASAFTILIALLWVRACAKPARILVVVAVLAGLAAAFGYVRAQSLKPKGGSGSTFAVRMMYLRKMVELFPDSPFFGVGPDNFPCVMIAAMARQHAETPQMFRGPVDYDAHNEWAQAVFELGIVGGLAYLAIPVITVALALRAWSRAPSEPKGIALMSCAAGLIAILASEAGTINLRHQIMPAWYWTLLGLSLAILRSRSKPTGPVSPQRRPILPLRLAAGLGAAAIMVVVVIDLRGNLAHAAGRMEMGRGTTDAESRLLTAATRLGPANWLWTHADLATLRLNRLRSLRKESSATSVRQNVSPSPEVAEAARLAVSSWKELHHRCPGYPEAGYRLAEAQFLSGDRVAATETLRRHLREIDPYDEAANLLLVSLEDEPPAETIAAVRRALYRSAWDSRLASISLAALHDPGLAATWPDEVAKALSRLNGVGDDESDNLLAPETLRIEALRLAASGNLGGAANMERKAAEAYRGLHQSDSPFRRVPMVVADCWHMSGRYLFDSDPSQFEEAARCLTEAERLSRLRKALVVDQTSVSMDDIQLANRLLSSAEIRRALGFSAMMQLAQNANPQEAVLRVACSLPEPRRNPRSIEAETTRLAAELVRRFAALPPPRRPATYDRLVSLSQSAAPDSNPRK